MRFIADQAQLAKALGQVIRVIAPQNTIAYLAGVQIEGFEDRLRLYATDLTSAIQAEIPATVNEPGTVLVPAQVFSDLVHRLPTASVEISGDPEQGRVVVKYGRNQATIHGFGNQTLPEFPAIADEGSSHQTTVESDVVARIARQILFACSRDEGKPLLKGVALEAGDGHLVWAATDGSRLSHSWEPVPELRDPPISCVLPAKALVEAARLAQAAPTLRWDIGRQLIRVEAAGVTLTSRLLDGQYPEYRRVIPEEYAIEARVDLNALRGAVERVNLIANRDRAGSIRIRHQLGSLELSTSTQDVGESLEIVDCDSHGPEMDLLFNPHYFLDALKSLDTEDVLIDFSGPQSPARFRETGDSRYTHILLPLRQLV